MSTQNGWLSSIPGIPVRHDDLSGRRGNGPFTTSRPCLGWILHVNVDENGTPVWLFEAGPPANKYEVTPTIQVFKSADAGGVVQFLPLNVQPWCQIAGNFNYGAAETAGNPDEPLTDFQLDALAYYHAEMHKALGVADAVADAPGQKGIGTHQMGGAAWGGHACPGTIRQNQRPEIIRRAQALLTPEIDMTPEQTEEMIQTALLAYSTGDDQGPFTHKKYPNLIRGHAQGVFDRLGFAHDSIAALKKKVFGE